MSRVKEGKKRTSELTSIFVGVVANSILYFLIIEY